MSDRADQTRRAGERGGALLGRLRTAWRALAPEGRLAAGAALLLFLTMFLPWYQLNAVVNDRVGGRILGDNMNAFGVFSFVEAAVLLVAVAVLVLLFARAEGRSFHLPGGDGTVVTAAGGWVALLLVWRLFDKPDVGGQGVGNVGIQWGMFFALAAAGLLVWAGLRMRAAEASASAAAAGPDAPIAPEERAARRRRRAEQPPGTEVTPPLPPEEPPAAPREEPPTQRLPEPQPDPPTQRLPRPEPERLWDDR